MAEVRIEEVPVTGVFHEGRGAEITESWVVKGESHTRRWACWFDTPHGLSVGDVVTVTGLLGVKVDEWVDKEQKTRHTAKVSLNGARIIGSPASTAPSQPVQGSGDSGEPWATAGPSDGYTDEAPF